MELSEEQRIGIAKVLIQLYRKARDEPKDHPHWRCLYEDEVLMNAMKEIRGLIVDSPKKEG